MNVIKVICHTVTGAADTVVKKNRKRAQLNRIRVVIEGENSNINRAYIALGKHYYASLRDPSKEEPERLCVAIDQASQRIERARKRWQELRQEEQTASCTEEPESTCEQEAQELVDEAQKSLVQQAVSASQHVVLPFSGEAASAGDEALIPDLPEKE